MTTVSGFEEVFGELRYYDKLPEIKRTKPRKKRRKKDMNLEKTFKIEGAGQKKNGQYFVKAFLDNEEIWFTTRSNSHFGPIIMELKKGDTVDMVYTTSEVDDERGKRTFYNIQGVEKSIDVNDDLPGDPPATPPLRAHNVDNRTHSIIRQTAWKCAATLYSGKDILDESTQECLVSLQRTIEKDMLEV